MESHLNVIRHKKEIKDQSIKCFRVSPNANPTTRLVEHVAEFFEPKNKTEQTHLKKNTIHLPNVTISHVSTPNDHLNEKK